MVHALQEIHRLLESTGRLIDIHPVAAASQIEIHQGGKTALVGDLLVQEWCTDYGQADQALAEVARGGLFTVEREREFDSLTHYGSAAELRMSQLDALEKFARDAAPAVEAVSHVEELAARSDEMMSAAPSGAELILREPTRMSRLRPN